MRRILHSALVLLVVAALIAPLSASEAAARTPICCLGKGEHHCLGQMHASGGAAPQGFSGAAEKCPYSSLALAAMHGPDLAPPVVARGIVVTSHRVPLLLKFKSSGSACAIRARLERGPPPPSLD